jgi:hypothetical protein
MRRGTLAKVGASFLSNKTQNRSLQGCCSGRACMPVLGDGEHLLFSEAAKGHAILKGNHA